MTEEITHDFDEGQPISPCREVVDYTAMNGPALLLRLGDDAYRWAEAFCQHVKKYDGGKEIDQGWMITWFANAIEHSHDVRRWRMARFTAHAEVKPSAHLP